MWILIKANCPGIRKNGPKGLYNHKKCVVLFGLVVESNRLNPEMMEGSLIRNKSFGADHIFIRFVDRGSQVGFAPLN